MYLYLFFCEERIRAHWFVNRALNKCCTNKNRQTFGNPNNSCSFFRKVFLSFPKNYNFVRIKIGNDVFSFLHFDILDATSDVTVRTPYSVYM